MKKTRLFLVSLFAVVMLSLINGCGLTENDAAESDVGLETSNRLSEKDIYYIDKAELLEMVFDRYDMLEVIEWQYGSIWVFCDVIGFPEIYLVFDELIAQGYYEDIDYLRTLADKIGYAPSAMFGDYVADGGLVIHHTDKPCFENIDSSEMEVLGPFENVREIREKIEDGDEYLERYSLCTICFDVSN